MKKLFFAMAAILLLAGCSQRRPAFSLNGAWVLHHVASPWGYNDSYSAKSETQLLLYEGDSAVYVCGLTQTAQALVVEPKGKYIITLIDKGGGEHLYMEGEDPRPLTVKNDTTIIIQRNGVLHTYHRVDSIAREWGSEICDIIENDLSGGVAGSEIRHYVLSATERRQAGVIHGLIYAIVGICVLMLFIAQIALSNRYARRRLYLQLQQIQEAHDERPQPVRQAMESVESAFFASDEYLSLQRRMASGQRLGNDEWNGIEAQLKRFYPGFTTQLRTLYPMSELEYQVCLLVKLRIAPKDIAAVLARDMSTISTVRSRLYKKVFGKKGGTKEWDDFVLSI